jgi:hypothetical protein
LNTAVLLTVLKPNPTHLYFDASSDSPMIMILRYSPFLQSLAIITSRNALYKVRRHDIADINEQINELTRYRKVSKKTDKKLIHEWTKLNKQLHVR